MPHFLRKTLMFLGLVSSFTLAACNQAVVPQTGQTDQASAETQPVLPPADEEEPSSIGDWFNDDWRDDFPPQPYDGPNMIYTDLVHMKDLSMPVEGEAFEVADYQRLVCDYLELYGRLWLEASAEQPDDRVAISGFQVVKDPELVYMTPTGEVPAIFECWLSYSLRPQNSLDAFKVGSGREDYPQAGWYKPTSIVVFQIDSTNTLSYVIGGTDFWFGGGKKGVIPIGRINNTRRLYGWFTDNSPQLGSETVTVNGKSYRHVEEFYQTYRDEGMDRSRTAFDQFADDVRSALPADMAAELLATGAFIDVEGELYMQERTDPPRPQIISEKWGIAEQSWAHSVYRAEVVQQLDGKQSTHTYDYVFDNGELVEFDYF